MWLLYHDGLLTKWKKNWMDLGSAMRKYYGDIEKDTIYILWDFPLAMYLWLWLCTLICNHFSLQVTRNIAYIVTCRNMRWNSNDDWKVFLATSCHSLWSWHNKESHDGNFSRLSCLMTHNNKLVQNCNKCKNATNIIMKHQRTLKLIKQEAPSLEWVKLNTDGARDKKRNVSCRWIIMGTEGNV